MTTGETPERVTPLRIELRESSSFGFVVDDDGGRRGDTKVTHVALIHPINDDGRATRKPAAKLTADTRADVLRLLADWIEVKGDPNLVELIAGDDAG